MSKKRGLGQGLSALISDDLEEKIAEKNTSGIKKIKTTQVEPNREQPRKVFDEDALGELADSIKQFGIIQPIIVTKKDTYYEIIAGERRWRAAKIAGLKEVPVIIKSFSEVETLEVSLIENIQRENLNSIEEAIAYQRLIDEFNLKQDEIAEKVSKSRSAVTNTLRLLNLDKRVQQMIVDEMISSGHARTLLSIPDKNIQYEIAMKIFDEKLSVRETEKYIKNYNKPKSKVKKEINMEIAEIYKKLENDIKEILGTKVTINKKNNKLGKIEIEYYSNEDLDRIIELLHSIKHNN